MIFLTKTDILEIHRRAIDEFGGSHGVLNGALESAVVAAENREWYENADLMGCAASYAFHLTRAHAFVESNKRVGAAVTEVFILVNNAALEASENDLYDFFMGIAAGDISRDAAEQWLRARINTRRRA